MELYVWEDCYNFVINVSNVCICNLLYLVWLFLLFNIFYRIFVYIGIKWILYNVGKGNFVIINWCNGWIIMMIGILL